MNKPRKEDLDDFFLELQVRNIKVDAILEQEKSGQVSFVSSDVLPTTLVGNAKETLENWGVEFLGEVEDDPLFQYVKLPEGWKKQPTDHSMWSYLVDDQGEKMASIFYRAGRYDRRAFLRLTEDDIPF